MLQGGREVDLLKNYPRSKRNLVYRAAKKTTSVRTIARKFGREFFDGDRLYGYGGFSYHPRFWTTVVQDFIKYYKLTNKSSILDVGCAKGFMLFDFQHTLPGARLKGIDISSYAIEHALAQVKPYLLVGDAKKLPFADTSFDLVISINTVHNLPLQECKRALREIERVAKKHAFITVDAYSNDDEKKRMEIWNLTARTYMSTKKWKQLFAKIGYSGDYWWFIP